MYCAISGEVPSEPVVSPQGNIFEKRLIVKAIETTGKCPITGEDLTIEQLIPVRVPQIAKPRVPAATSIPGMLGLFQNEWDAVMLETYNLRKQLEEARQELSQALYQHDAACRVIARLSRERDEARRQLAAAGLHATQVAAPAEEMDVEEAEGMTDSIIKKLTAHSQKLSEGRKNRKNMKFPDLAPASSIEKYSKASSHPIHKSSEPGILCVDIHPSHPEITATGGVDSKIAIFNRNSNKVLASLGGHGKRVTDVLFHPSQDVLLSSSADKTVRVWSGEGDSGNYSTRAILKTHESEVSSVTLHPSGDYYVAASLDKTWSFNDLRSNRTLVHIAEPVISSGITSAQFHPDGLILGTATADSRVFFWDVKSQGTLATFEGHQGKATALAFSENGFYVATAAEDSTVKLWDLRKLKNFHTITLDAPAHSVAFDYSACYLAVGSNDVRVYGTRSWNQIGAWQDHSDAVTDVAFGPNASFLCSTSMDRTLKFYS